MLCFFFNKKVYYNSWDYFQCKKSDGEGETISVDQLQRQLTNQLVQPFTFKYHDQFLLTSFIYKLLFFV